MRLALITSWLSDRGGGVPAALLPLARTFDDTQTIDVTLIGFDAPSACPAHPIAICPTLPVPGFPISLQMAKVLGEGHFDIVHTHGLWSFASIAALNWHRRTGGPMIVSPHGMLDGWALRNSAWKKRLALKAFEWRHLQRAAVIHALCEPEAAAIRRLGLTNPIAVIPNGVDPPFELPNYPKPDFLTGDDRRVLLFIGRIHPKKGIDTLAKAWSIALAERPELGKEWQVIVAGWDDGGHSRSLRQLVHSLDLDHHIRFVGPVFDRLKMQTFLHADAFILPSKSEGLPMAALEAWTYGLPTFLTAECNLTEGYAQGASFQIGSKPNEIAEQFVEVLPQSALLATAGAKGRAFAEASFSWTRVANMWRSVHEWSTGRSARPDFVEVP